MIVQRFFPLLPHRRIAPVPALLASALLAACNPATAPLSGDRAEAREIATRLVAARDPIVEPRPVAQCAAASATREEATALVEADRAGERARAQDILTTMLRKTSTQECLRSVGSPDFL